jgi:hypothetical protein
MELEKAPSKLGSHLQTGLEMKRHHASRRIMDITPCMGVVDFPEISKTGRRTAPRTATKPV